jgi:hypothetical protein
MGDYIALEEGVVKVNKETVKESVVIASLSGPGSSPERL